MAILSLLKHITNIRHDSVTEASFVTASPNAEVVVSINVCKDALLSKQLHVKLLSDCKTSNNCTKEAEMPEAARAVNETQGVLLPNLSV